MSQGFYITQEQFDAIEAAHNTVRRQGFWNQSGPKLREGLAHLVGLIMRRVGGDASVAFGVSFV